MKRHQRVGDHIYLKTYYASGMQRYAYILLAHYERDEENSCLFWTVYVYKTRKVNGQQYILKEHWHPRALAHFTAYETEYLLKQRFAHIEKQMTQSNT